MKRRAWTVIEAIFASSVVTGVGTLIAVAIVVFHFLAKAW